MAGRRCEDGRFRTHDRRRERRRRSGRSLSGHRACARGRRGLRRHLASGFWLSAWDARTWRPWWCRPRPPPLPTGPHPSSAACRARRQAAGGSSVPGGRDERARAAARPAGPVPAVLVLWHARRRALARPGRPVRRLARRHARHARRGRQREEEAPQGADQGRLRLVQQVEALLRWPAPLRPLQARRKNLHLRAGAGHQRPALQGRAERVARPRLALGEQRDLFPRHQPAPARPRRRRLHRAVSQHQNRAPGGLHQPAHRARDPPARAPDPRGARRRALACGAAAADRAPRHEAPQRAPHGRDHLGRPGRLPRRLPVLAARRQARDLQDRRRGHRRLRRLAPARRRGARGILRRLRLGAPQPPRAARPRALLRGAAAPPAPLPRLFLPALPLPAHHPLVFRQLDARALAVRRHRPAGRLPRRRPPLAGPRPRAPQDLPPPRPRDRRQRRRRADRGRLRAVRERQRAVLLHLWHPRPAREPGGAAGLLGAVRGAQDGRSGGVRGGAEGGDGGEKHGERGRVRVQAGRREDIPAGLRGRGVVDRAARVRGAHLAVPRRDAPKSLGGRPHLLGPAPPALLVRADPRGAGSRAADGLAGRGRPAPRCPDQPRLHGALFRARAARCADRDGLLALRGPGEAPVHGSRDVRGADRADTEGAQGGKGGAAADARREDAREGLHAVLA